MKKIILILLVIGCLMPCTIPEAKAIDPITMAILAPIAMRAAEAAKPYLVKMMLGTGKGVLKLGKDAMHILYLPLGLLEMTLGAPFHKFRQGVVHTIRGGLIAPTRLFLHMFLLPVYMTGAQINI